MKNIPILLGKKSILDRSNKSSLNANSLPTLTLSLKLTDRLPIKEIEIETEAKSPDVTLSNISDRAHFPDSVDHQADDRLISQLKEFGLYEQFLQKTTEAQNIPSLDITGFYITGFYSFCQLNQINLVSLGEFSDILDDLPNRSEPIDLALVQNQDEVIREVMQWKERGSPDMSPNLPIALRKYRKQFPRLIIQDKVLYRLFYDDQGKVQHKQFCVPKSLWREFTACITRQQQAIWESIKRLKNLEKDSTFRISQNT